MSFGGGPHSCMSVFIFPLQLSDADTVCRGYRFAMLEISTSSIQNEGSKLIILNVDRGGAFHHIEQP